MEQAGSNLTSVRTQARARVLLADDFPPFREMLRSVLPLSGNVEFAGQANTGNEAVAFASKLRPEVIVMDYRMPEMDGVAAAIRILEVHPKAAILITSLSFERQYVLRALTSGARGYLAKDEALTSLPEALSEILAGRTYLSPSVAALIQRTAPPNPLALTQEVLWTFDREAPALLQCAHIVATGSASDAAVSEAFLAYWMARRKSQVISDPQTWLLLSVAARLFPGEANAKPWSLVRAHPSDRDLKNRDAGLAGHVAGCRSCYLAWTLAAHDTRSTAETEQLRESLIHNLEVPDEPALFLVFVQRQAEVMRLAAAELKRLLGSEAGTGWMRREAPAGSWLGAMLGRPAA